MFFTREGFTIIEILIVIAIMAILGAAASPLYSNFLVITYFRNKTNELVASLRTAQLNTIAGKEGSRWGVHISSSEIIMFKGASYVVPGTAFDYKYSIPQSITITQGDIVFNKLTGNPNASAVITLTSNAGESKTVSINAMGAVNVQ